MTDDWRVIGSTDDFFKGMKAHRLLLARNKKREKIAAKNEERLRRLATSAELPTINNEWDERAFRRKLATQARQKARDDSQNGSEAALAKEETDKRRAREEVEARQEERAAIERRLADREHRLRANMGPIPPGEERRLSAGSMRDLPPLSLDNSRSSLLINAEDRDRAERRRKETEVRLAARAKRIEGNTVRIAAAAAAREAAKQAELARLRQSLMDEELAKADAKQKALDRAVATAKKPEPEVDEMNLAPAEKKRKDQLAAGVLWKQEADAVLGPLREMGWRENWLELAGLALARTIDGGRSGWLTTDELLLVLQSPSFGLNLSKSALSELLSFAVELTNDDSNSGAGAAEGHPAKVRGSLTADTLTLKYEPFMRELAEKLMRIALSDAEVFADPWCTVYDGCTQVELRYNKATEETRINPPPSVLEPASTGNEVDHGALGRSAVRVLAAAGRDEDDVGGGDHIMEEDNFYLVLQSKSLGLRLTPFDIEGIKDELPPEEDGYVNYGEVCHELEDILAAVYYENPRPVGEEWCRLYNEQDGIFYYNKKRRVDQIKRPRAFKPAHADDDIDDFLHTLFTKHDRENTGGIPDEIFWHLLEAPPPTGLAIAGEDSVGMMTTFDVSVNGAVPYRIFVPLFKPLMMLCSSENGAREAGHEWVELASSSTVERGDETTFWFDKVTAVSIRSDPATYSGLVPALKMEPVHNVGPLILEAAEESNPVYAKLSQRFPSTINMFASYLPPSKFPVMSAQGGATASGSEQTNEESTYKQMSTQYPSSIGLFGNISEDGGPPLLDADVLKIKMSAPFGMSINGDVAHDLGMFITAISSGGSAAKAKSWEGQKLETGMRIVKIGDKLVHRHADKAEVINLLRKAVGVVEISFVEDARAYATFLHEKVTFQKLAVMDPFELALSSPFGMNIAGTPESGIFVTGVSTTGSLRAAGKENETLVEVGTKIISIEGKNTAGLSKKDVVQALKTGAKTSGTVNVGFVFDPEAYVSFANIKKEAAKEIAAQMRMLPTEFVLEKPLGMSMSGAPETGVFILSLKDAGSAVKAVHDSGRTLMPNLRVVSINGETCVGQGVRDISMRIMSAPSPVTMGFVDDPDAFQYFLEAQHIVKQSSHAATKIQAGFRGMQARRQLKVEQEAATKIQAGFRGYKARQSLTPMEATVIDTSTVEDDVDVDTLETNAATAIQAGWRGYKARKEVATMRTEVMDMDTMTIVEVDAKDLEEQTKAATKIQAGWRGHQARKEFQGKRTSVVDVDTEQTQTLKLQNIDEAAATTIQAGWRGHQARKEVDNLAEEKMIAEEHEGDDEVDFDDPIVSRASVTIQSGFRGMKARKEVQAMRAEKYGEENVAAAAAAAAPAAEVAPADPATEEAAAAPAAEAEKEEAAAAEEEEDGEVTPKAIIAQALASTGDAEVPSTKDAKAIIAAALVGTAVAE